MVQLLQPLSKMFAREVDAAFCCKETILSKTKTVNGTGVNVGIDLNDSALLVVVMDDQRAIT